MTLESSMHNYEELVQLQADAKRCIRQAERLKELNPSRAGSYSEQLLGCLSVINKQADKAANRKLR
jgi:hypothetical protein